MRRVSWGISIKNPVEGSEEIVWTVDVSKIGASVRKVNVNVVVKVYVVPNKGRA